MPKQHTQDGMNCPACDEISEHRGYVNLNLGSPSQYAVEELFIADRKSRSKAITENSELKQSNPKNLIGSDKLPFHLWPETATALGCLAILDGNLKYGRTNWRVAGVKASIYFDACKRHINAWFDEGEDIDPDSGLPHLAHALACLAIIVDAQAAGKLTDDRLIRGGYRKLVSDLTPHVARLRAKHADKNPKHYTIADNEAEGK